MRKPRNLFVCVSEEREDEERGIRQGRKVTVLRPEVQVANHGKRDMNDQEQKHKVEQVDDG